MTGRPFTTDTGRAARDARFAGAHWHTEVFPRANEPGEYVCPTCGEKLSGPGELYACPNVQFGVRLRSAA